MLFREEIQGVGIDSARVQIIQNQVDEIVEVVKGLSSSVASCFHKNREGRALAIRCI